MENNSDRPVKKKRTKTIVFGTLLIAVLAFAAYIVYNIYLRPDNFLRQIYLIPKDAIYILETDDPINNWHKFTKSKPWQYLREQQKMEEIDRLADKTDSILQANKTLLDLLGKRNLLISAHVTRKSDYDYLFVVDVKKASKLESLKNQLEILFKAGDFQVTQRKFKGESVYELYDPIERTTLYLAIVGNHLICSYTGLLVEKSITEKDDPFIGRDLYYLDVEQKVPNGGLCKIYINYRNLDSYLTMLTGISDPDINNIYRPLSYSGLQFMASDDRLSLKGYTGLNDSTDDSYLPALLRSGSRPITAQKVLSVRTAFYADMGFDDPVQFIRNVESVLEKDKEAYDTFKKNWDLIEKKLKIDIRKNFLSWMDGEVAFAQHTPGSLDRQNEFVVVIKMKNKNDAIKNLNFIEEAIRKNTPVKFKTIEYEGYGIHFLEMKGFFRLLFGKMFDKLNKPYYTIIDDYAVFSNSTATLLSMIEDYRMGQTLEKDNDFKRFIKEFNSKSSVFVYTNTKKFFPLARDLVSPANWSGLQDNQNFVLCFPQTGFQLTGENEMFDTRWFGEFDIPGEETEDEDMETETVNFAEREDTLQNLERFYLEKFGKNVYTEFYEDGNIKSKSEISKGIKNGKYQAFYPDGKLQVNGKFKNNRKTGTWNYFDEDGKLVRKEKWKDGQLKE
ncbi:MAG: DUF3352 domain-containing protein [Candidatus Azobacteroides sp.]|nr:DUF3352 domain-containing protein [Candidatus Azobacteroides sp.]